jgi:hypothetical protein
MAGNYTSMAEANGREKWQKNATHTKMTPENRGHAM